LNNINPSTRKYLEQIEKAHTKRTESGAHFSEPLGSELLPKGGPKMFESQPATINNKDSIVRDTQSYSP
jgi:hypothetical protein